MLNNFSAMTPLQVVISGIQYFYSVGVNCCLYSQCVAFVSLNQCAFCVKWTRFSKTVSSCLSLFAVLLLSSVNFVLIDSSLLRISGVKRVECSLFVVVHQHSILTNAYLTVITVSHGQLIFLRCFNIAPLNPFHMYFINTVQC